MIIRWTKVILESDMDVNFSIPMPAIWIMVVSLALFIGATWLTITQGLWDGCDDYGIGAAFILLCYLLLWVAPSLAIWAIWATWFK